MLANFLLTFNGIMPIVCLIGFGYVLKSTHIISETGFKEIDKLGYKFLIPVMLFYNIYSADLSKFVNLKAILFMICAIIVIFIFSMLIVGKITEGNTKKAAVVHALCHSNLAVVGLPVVSAMFGPEETAIYSIMVAVSSPVVNPLMVYEHTYFKKENLNILSLIKKILLSPYIVGTLMGILFYLLGIKLPTFLNTFVVNLKNIASPICLISMGGSFIFSGFKDNKKEIIVSSLLKCFIYPLIIIFIAAALGFRNSALLDIAIIFASPCAVATYSYSVAIYGDAQLASQIVVYSTILSMFTIFIFIFSLLQLGMI